MLKVFVVRLTRLSIHARSVMVECFVLSRKLCSRGEIGHVDKVTMGGHRHPPEIAKLINEHRLTKVKQTSLCRVINVSQIPAEYAKRGEELGGIGIRDTIGALIMSNTFSRALDILVFELA
jgi:hypothetical protein